MKTAEAARIVEPQCAAGVEHEVEMIMREARRVRRQHAQAARHTKVQQQRSGLELEQQVLGSPLRVQNALPSHPRR